MEFNLILKNRILQLTNATEQEIEFLKKDLTVEWINYSNGKRKKKSKTHIKNSTFVPSGFWYRLISHIKNGKDIRINNLRNIVDTNIDVDTIDEWIDNQEFKVDWLVPRWYQRKAVFLASKFAISRGDFATGSGKTFICYLVTRYYLEQKLKNPNACIVLVVPSLQLVTQTINDWIGQYQKDDFLKIAYVTEGQTNYDGTQNVIIGNIQSLINLDKEFFKNVNGVIYDEGHKLALANEEGGGRNDKNGIDNISQYQQFFAKLIGNELDLVYSVSGSWYDKDTREDMEATSISGDILVSVPAHLLMEEKSLTPVDIHEMLFNWDYRTCEKFYSSKDTNPNAKKRNSYELDFIRSLDKREDFIINWVSKTEMNQLCLFKAKDKCLRRFEKKLRERCPHKEILVIVGEISNEKREEIKKYTEENHNVVILATYGTMSTGVSINNLFTLHLVEPPKSFIWLRQSIGRMVRLHELKSVAKILSYVDVFKRYDPNWYGSNTPNIVHGHLKHREEIYKSQKFPYTIHNLQM